MKRLLAFLLLLLGIPAAAFADPAMWVVKSKDSTVYLLGTIHALKPGVNWRSDKLAAAFGASSEYWMEADIQEDPAIAGTYVLNFGTDSRHPLSEKLTPDDYALFLKSVARHGLDEGRVRFVRPWFATLLLTGDAVGGSGYDSANGVDRALESDAKQAGKTVKTFETPSQQLSFLAHLSPEVELAMLVDSLHALRDGSKAGTDELDALSAAWLAGDTKGLSAAGVDKMRTESPEMYDVIITRRNTAWVPKIAELMKTPGTYFIAVGAAHMLGKGGVPELLKAEGYKVERY